MVTERIYYCRKSSTQERRVGYVVGGRNYSVWNSIFSPTYENEKKTEKIHMKFPNYAKLYRG